MSDKLKSLLKQVSSAAGEVIEAIQAADTKIAELQKQRQQIGDAPISRADFLNYFTALIDRKAGNFGAIIAREIDKADISFFAMEGGRGLNVDMLTPGRNVPVPILEEACYWYLKPAMLARVGEIADGMDFPEDAIPIESRRTMIAEIDEEIQRLRNERNDMAAQLQKAGIVR